MDSDLPQDPKEREVFLRALRDYSEMCEPPELTPDCPFSEQTAPGVRGCGEQCMDLLARYNAPMPGEDVALGGGISIHRARRPRARRGEDGAAKAFDAREIYLEDRASKLLPDWRFPAVLSGLGEAVQEPPPADTDRASDRRSQISALIDLAEQRGLDFETHIAPYLAHFVAVSIFTRLVGHRESEGTITAFDSTGGWYSLAKKHIDAVKFDGPEKPRREALGKLFGLTLTWALTADAEDLLNWTPPSPQAFEEPRAIWTPPPDDDGTWILERFTKTYLREWSLPALEKEWRYLHGQLAAPCPTADMSVRKVSEAKLATEIADQLVTKTARTTEPELADRLVQSAVTFIGEGRRTEAAALFEAALHNEPESPYALNNLGFCLLPDDPQRALGYLERAVETGRGDTELIDANRILALASIGRFTSATDLATGYLERHTEHNVRSATWLWDIDSVLNGGIPELTEHPDLRSYAETILTKVKYLSN